MLGQPLSMLLPEVVGFKLEGQLKEGVTATDLVLTVTQMLRKQGVVGKFVEFFGPGLDYLSVADKATIGNMAPEYGATCGFFPVDAETIDYLKTSGRSPARVALVAAYAKAQGLFRTAKSPDPVFTETLKLDLGDVVPSMAGPKRPEGRVALPGVGEGFALAMASEYKKADDAKKRYPVEGRNFDLGHGDVVIAAITSCTNTSNPSVLIGAGLLARNAAARGLTAKPWVKTSLAPGSQVVAEYLSNSGLQLDLDKVGFNLIGFGCTTCIGNSGPLPEEISKTINDNGIIAAAVLSGNRNFEGRVSPGRAGQLSSIAAAGRGLRAGRNGDEESRGRPDRNRPGWPTGLPERHLADDERDQRADEEVRHRGDLQEALRRRVQGRHQLAQDQDRRKRNLSLEHELDLRSEPALLRRHEERAGADRRCRRCAHPGDVRRQDHHRPHLARGRDQADFAGRKISVSEHQVRPADFNQYGTRRGNHEIMMRGTFANIRIKNFMLKGADGNIPEGGLTKHWPDGEQMSIYDAAMKYQQEKVPLVVFAGAEYGNGSSRDWAAKGTRLLGVRAVICQSFERIHRSNLVGMGVLPLTFESGTSWTSLGLKGDETVTIRGLQGDLKPRQKLTAEIVSADGTLRRVSLLCRIDTLDELEYYRNGGILHYVLRKLAA